MPTASDRQNEARRLTYTGMGEALTMLSELLTATVVWGAIGFGLDKLFKTGPVLLVIGAVVGHATGIYMINLRARQMRERARRKST